MIYTVVKFAAVAVLSYFLGNFNSAIAISKLKKNDIRKLGSGNPGSMRSKALCLAFWVGSCAARRGGSAPIKSACTWAPSA